MKIFEINKPVTSATLNESLAKRFGVKIDIEKFTLEQLEDARNKIRTSLSQFETNESFSKVNTSELYQKNKLFLDVLNSAIAERENYTVMSTDNTDAISTISTQPDNTDAISTISTQPDDDATVMSSYDWKKDILRIAKMLTSPQSSLNDAQIGDWIQRTVPRSKLGWKGIRKFLIKNPVDDPTVAGEINKFVAGFNQEVVGEGNDFSNNNAVIEGYFIHATKLFEGEEDKAELVMAAKDMVDRLTGWMEDTAEMQSESMLELADAIRDEMGQQQSDGFVNQVKPALEALYAAMETTRGSLTGGVAMLTGEQAPDMGLDTEEPTEEPEGDMEPTVDQEEDEFVAAEPAAGGEEAAGRARRESIERSRKLGVLLSSKKKS